MYSLSPTLTSQRLFPTECRCCAATLDNQIVRIDLHDAQRIGKLQRLSVAYALPRQHQTITLTAPCLIFEGGHIDRLGTSALFNPTFLKL